MRSLDTIGAAAYEYVVSNTAPSPSPLTFFFFLNSQGSKGLPRPQGEEW